MRKKLIKQPDYRRFFSLNIFINFNWIAITKDSSMRKFKVIDRLVDKYFHLLKSVICMYSLWCYSLQLHVFTLAAPLNFQQLLTMKYIFQLLYFSLLKPSFKSLHDNIWQYMINYLSFLTYFLATRSSVRQMAIYKCKKQNCDPKDPSFIIRNPSVTQQYSSFSSIAQFFKLT